MKILAIESSGPVAGCALANEEKIIADFYLDLKLTHSQTLLPMVDQLVKSTGTDLQEIDAIAVSGGPGSFTGLRIGSATAKGLAQALNIPIVSVPTTEVLASEIYGFKGLLCPIMDARRNQVYTGLYRYNENGLEIVKDTTACMIEDIATIVNETGEAVMFMGDGVPVFREKLKQIITGELYFAPLHLNLQHGAALAIRGLEAFKQGKAVACEDHVPDYYRLSQAERERNENT